MTKCPCGSYAINDDPERCLCDVCMWVRQADEALAEVARLRKQLDAYEADDG